jgi:cyd operon protein YbgT
MWYFSWILGLGFASAFAILNAMWLESREIGRVDAAQVKADGPSPPC